MLEVLVTLYRLIEAHVPRKGITLFLVANKTLRLHGDVWQCLVLPVPGTRIDKDPLGDRVQVGQSVGHSSSTQGGRVMAHCGPEEQTKRNLGAARAFAEIKECGTKTSEGGLQFFCFREQGCKTASSVLTSATALRLPYFEAVAQRLFGLMLAACLCERVLAGLCSAVPSRAQGLPRNGGAHHSPAGAPRNTKHSARVCFMTFPTRNSETAALEQRLPEGQLSANVL